MTDKKVFIIDQLILSFTLIFCVIYSIYKARFAELHVVVPSLNIPVFVGEMLLGVCCILFFTKLFILQKDKSIRLRKTYYWLTAFYLFIILKTLLGYIDGGVLALRHSALFYYSFFAMLAYSSLNERILTQRNTIALFVLLVVLISSKLITMYYWPAYFMSLFLLAFSIEEKKKRVIFVLISFISLLVYYKSLMIHHRAHLVGVMAMLGFIFLYFVVTFQKGKVKKKVGIFLLIAIVVVFGMTKIVDKNAMKSLFIPRATLQGYYWHNSVYMAKQNTFKPQNLEPQLYNKGKMKRNKEWNEPESAFIQRIKKAKIPVYVWDQLKQDYKEVNYYSINPTMELFVYNKPEEKYELLKQVVIKKQKSLNLPPPDYRSLEKASNHILFRIFIWRDMIKDVIDHKAILGLSFGHPQRSLTIEILGWARGEWTRDGWITPHNSFLHMIYRAGIVGFLYFAAIIFCFLKMLKIFYNKKSIIGGLLLGSLVYWLTVSNFLVFLELPYSAIPFWSMFGLALAYSRILKHKLSHENTHHS